MATPIEVAVRNSSGPQGDEIYLMLPTDTILELKVRVQAKHPAQPAPEQQRLIFCGKILNDADTIATLGTPPDGGNRLTVILFYRTTPASPPPQTPPPQAAAPPPFGAFPNAQVPPNQGAFPQGAYGPAMPGMGPMFGGFPMQFGFPPAHGFQPQGFFMGGGMMGGPQQVPMGQPGYPGMFAQQFQWQQQQPGMNGVPGMHPQQPPMIRRYHFRVNLRYLFLAALFFFLIAISGSANSTFYTIVLLGAAWVYMRLPQAHQPQQAGQNAQNVPANQNRPNANANNGNQNGNPNNAGQGNGFDDLVEDQQQAEWLSVPQIFRYDWRVHRGLLGEVLGFVCPLVFSLWPSWDPSILGDHPDVVRRRQEEEQQQQQQQQRQAQQQNPDAVPANAQ